MSARPLNIVVNRNSPHVVETFSRLGNVIALDTSGITGDTVREADILIVRSETRVDRALLEKSAVRFVGTVTIGTDHIDMEYLKEKGVEFASAPGSNANSVAEYLAAALLLWSERSAEQLKGRTIGIVGAGNVGNRVAGVARSLGMNVLLNDPPLARMTGDSSYRPLDELMNADFISLHVPLTKVGQDPTYHLFDEARLSRMKRNSVLINTSRGGVVKTSALRAALASNSLTAILDVWEGEPDIDTGLLGQVVVGTPHIAGYSLDGKLNAVAMIYRALCGFLGVVPDALPGPGVDASVRLSIPPEVSGLTEILRSAVRQSYDVELDDSLLRQIVSRPQEERGKYFMKLRAGYRVRREFFNHTVELKKTQTYALEALRGLGFKTQMTEGLT